ncbi:MAG: molybdopterin-dependent oxidoreductase [Thermodesulfobacteriota bacterium]|nr:molybdopterin-dependent oxidoreductase [Thermodesulfobacteriota bacterium]
MEKKIIILIMTVLFAVIPCSAFAKSGIIIISSAEKGEKVSCVDLKEMKAFGHTIKTIDPNFIPTGLTEFKGITIKKLFELAEVSCDKGVTIVGMDQYMGFISSDRIKRERVILAWEMNSKKISPLKGGPLKIIFDSRENVHGSNYTWYVKSFFPGRIENPALNVMVGKKETRLYHDQIKKYAKGIDKRSFSIPSGCRNDYPGKKMQVTALPLENMVESSVGKGSLFSVFLPAVKNYAAKVEES